jgi:hypothetical protein
MPCGAARASRVAGWSPGQLSGRQVIGRLGVIGAVLTWSFRMRSGARGRVAHKERARGHAEYRLFGVCPLRAFLQATVVASMLEGKPWP